MYEMSEMANRPFAKLLVRFDDSDNKQEDSANMELLNEQLADGKNSKEHDSTAKKRPVSSPGLASNNKKDRTRSQFRFNWGLNRLFVKDHHRKIETKGQKKVLNAVLSKKKDDLSETARNVMPVALEPLANHKAAIATVLVRLPNASYQSKEYSTSSPFMFGSTLVSINTVYMPQVKSYDSREDIDTPGGDQIDAETIRLEESV